MHHQPLPPVEAVGRPGDQILQPEAARERGEALVRRRGRRGGALGAAEFAEPADVVCERLRRPPVVGFIGGGLGVASCCVVLAKRGLGLSASERER